jgi:3-methyladenine DNA glycosylase AlkD
MNLDQILSRLRALSNEENRQGMARYGINTETAFGVKVTTLRQIAKGIGRDHALALQLWDSGFHEARILATIIDDPKQTTEAQVEAWLKDISSWDLCDGFAGNLIDKTAFAYQKAVEWTRREAEFERRAGFAVMAWLPVHDKEAPDEKFETFFPHIEAASDDGRTYVKKAVSWALRNIGKRSLTLNPKAIAVAERIAARDTKAAKWIASDVLRELRSEKVQKRLRQKAEKAAR